MVNTSTQSPHSTIHSCPLLRCLSVEKYRPAPPDSALRQGVIFVESTLAWVSLNIVQMKGCVRLANFVDLKLPNSKRCQTAWYIQRMEPRVVSASGLSKEGLVLAELGLGKGIRAVESGNY